MHRHIETKKTAPKGGLFNLLPGSGRTKLERARRFERPTLTLARLCSTPELRPHPLVRGRYPSRRLRARGKSAVCAIFFSFAGKGARYRQAASQINP